MKRITIFVMILLATFLLNQTLEAQVGLNKVAQSTMNFQLVGISPRASAMGDAFMAMGRGAESMFYNPAGIAESSRSFDVSLNITQWIADINFMAGAIVWNMKNYGAIGFSALAVDYGTIHGTSLIDPSEQAQYPLGYKDNGAVNNVGAYSFGLAYGKAVSQQFLIGGNVRLVGQNLGENIFFSSDLKKNNATKLVFDAGVKYYTGFKSFCFGMAIRNFSSSIKREEISEQLPILFTMGMAIDLFDFFSAIDSKDNSLTLAIDFLHPNNYSERVNFGLEYQLWERIALRGGYQTNQDLASWSVGAGLKQTIGSNLFEFDYSYSRIEIFDAVTRLSIGIAF